MLPISQSECGNLYCLQMQAIIMIMYNHLERFLCNYYGQTSPYEHLHNMFITGMCSSSPYCTCSSSEYNKDTQNCFFVVHINKVQLYGNMFVKLYFFISLF